MAHSDKPSENNDFDDVPLWKPITSYRVVRRTLFRILAAAVAVVILLVYFFLQSKPFDRDITTETAEFTFTYAPSEWAIIQNISQLPDCSLAKWKCIIAFGDTRSAYPQIIVAHFDYLNPVTALGVADRMQGEHSNEDPSIAISSGAEWQIGGFPAADINYRVQPVSPEQSVLRVKELYVVKENQVYVIKIWDINSDAFSPNLDKIDAFLGRIRFKATSPSATALPTRAEG